MLTTLADFADDTAFERYVLDRAMPLLPKPEGSSVIELGEDGSAGVAVGAGPAIVYVGLADSAGSAERQLSADDIRPLLFGTAWKVLDQLCEFALEVAGVPHDRGRQYSIALKVRRAANASVPPVQPFNHHHGLWSAVMPAYASAEVLRHSLVHRRLIVDPSTGDISGVPASGQPAPAPLTVDEQSAFCQVAVGVADSVITGALPTRQADQLGWSLDQLAAHHRQRAFGTPAVQGVIPRVIVRVSPGTSDDLQLDFDDLSSRARSAVQGVSHYNLEVHLPDGRILAGPLEGAPPGRAIFPLANPPSWLHRI